MKPIVAYILFLLFSLQSHAQMQFTNNGNFNIHNGGAISFYGNFINNGTYVDSGTVSTLKGSGTQQVGGSSVTTFKNLTLNNSAGCYLSSNENIKKVLTITSGTFTTTGYSFTLISDANGTASIAPILGNFAGNITMQRYLQPGATSWRCLASPVSGVAISNWQDDFITSGFPGSSFPGNPFISVYTYTESVPGAKKYGWTAPTNASNSIVPAAGYLCYVGPVPLTVDLTGPPVKFNQTFAVTYTPSAGPSDDGWVLVGNPYPSAIDWTSPSWTKSHINNAVYIWNNMLQEYTSWVSGASTNGGSNIIASSQAFWIQANAPSPFLSCTENIKITSNPSFFRLDTISAFNTLKLNFSGNGFKDETILRFGYGATNSFDAELDAYKFYSSNAQAPGISTEDFTKNDMSINSMPLADSAIDIPVKTLVGVSGNYTIKPDSSSVIPEGYCLVLEDLVTKAKISLDTFSAYTFSISDTTKSARFVLHMTHCGVAGNEQLAFERYQLNAYPNPTTDQVTVTYNSNSVTDNTILQLIELGTGKVLIKKELKSDENRTQLNLSEFADGVYSLMVSGNSKKPEHVKIIKIK